MAPRQDKRSRRQAPAPASTAATCPPEIWKQIADAADLKDCRHLCLVNHKVQQATNDSLKNRYTLLYLHPTKNSMRNLLDICYSGLYPNVTELCLLGDPMWSEIGVDHPNYRCNEYSDRNKAISQKAAAWSSPRFKAWPWRYEEITTPSHLKGSKSITKTDVDVSMTRNSASQSKNEQVPSERKSRSANALWEARVNNCIDPDTEIRQHAEFTMCYQPLLDALTRLPKLSTISYREAADLPGLNAVSSAQIQSHAHAVHTRRQPRAPATTGHRSDADVLYRLLSALKDRDELQGGIQRLDLRGELPFTEPVFESMYYLGIPRFPSQFDQAIENLRSLDISIDCGWKPNATYKIIIHRARNSLESLRIRLRANSNAWQQGSKQEYVSWLLTWLEAPEYADSRMPKLTSLEILFVDGPHTDTISRHRSGRWRNPAVITFRPGAIWDLYAEQLTTLRLQHIVNWDGQRRTAHGTYPTGVQPNAQYGVVETMRVDLTRLRDWQRQGKLKLRHFEWTVPLYQHDPKCKADDSTPLDLDGHCRRHHCGDYFDNTTLPSTADEMTKMAEEFGVELNADNVWDFGQVIMRDVESEKANGGEREDK